MIRLALALIVAVALIACAREDRCDLARLAVAAQPPGTLAYEMSERDLAYICGETAQ